MCVHLWGSAQEQKRGHTRAQGGVSSEGNESLGLAGVRSRNGLGTRCESRLQYVPPHVFRGSMEIREVGATVPRTSMEERMC